MVEAERATQRFGHTRKLALLGLSEALLTALLLFGIVTIVRWTFGPSPISDHVGSLHWRIAIVGLAVGLLLSAIMLFPLSRASGAHMKPAISLAMWRYGSLSRAAMLWYIAGQLLGSISGALLGRLIWGSIVSRPPLSFAVVHAAPHWTAAEVFPIEAATTAALVITVGLVLSNPRTVRATPFVVGTLICLLVIAFGNLTGGSDNPARQFGPAALSGQTSLLWVYLIAPLVGGYFAPPLQRLIHPRYPTTHSLCGSNASGSLTSAARPSPGRPPSSVCWRPNSQARSVLGNRRLCWLLSERTPH
jgi:glycerol uptake facilitator-like aquaporin